MKFNNNGYDEDLYANPMNFANNGGSGNSSNDGENGNGGTNSSVNAGSPKGDSGAKGGDVGSSDVSNIGSGSDSDAGNRLARNNNFNANVNEKQNNKSSQSGVGSFNTKSSSGNNNKQQLNRSNNSQNSVLGKQDEKSVDKGGKFDLKKSFLNKFKFKLQKNTKEEEKTEAEVNRCNPCNEFKAGNGLDFGCIDWGKCAFAKPCCKKFPQPCSCFAYMCVGITVVGGLVSSIILF